VKIRRNTADPKTHYDKWAAVYRRFCERAWQELELVMV